MIEGTITAAYYYGVPVANKEIRYQLQAEDQPIVTARTDAKGQVKFKFPTRDFRESQTLALSVSLPELNLTTGRNFVLATDGFSINVGTQRSVFVQGESFEVNVTPDAEGKPTGCSWCPRRLEPYHRSGKTGRTASRAAR